MPTIHLSGLPHLSMAQQPVELVERKGIGHPDFMSGEGGDGGQVGRGNRVNGVISLNRPAGNEAAAGKNPVSHVGKIYSLLSHQIAHHLYTLVDPVEEVYVWLCSQIGAPVEEPWVAAVQVRLAGSVEVADVEGVIKDIVQAELSDLPTFTDQLICGALPVY